jgi:hypothetical protein
LCLQRLPLLLHRCGRSNSASADERSAGSLYAHASRALQILLCWRTHNVLHALPSIKLGACAAGAHLHVLRSAVLGLTTMCLLALHMPGSMGARQTAYLLNSMVLLSLPTLPCSMAQLRLHMHTAVRSRVCTCHTVRKRRKWR